MVVIRWWGSGFGWWWCCYEIWRLLSNIELKFVVVDLAIVVIDNINSIAIVIVVKRWDDNLYSWPLTEIVEKLELRYKCKVISKFDKVKF